MKNLKLAILHFHPLEKYPPVMNMINFLEDNNVHFSVYSTFSKNRIERKFTASKNNIYRFGKENESFIRFFHYFYFNILTFLKLLFEQPDCILYYESYSALPAIWYKRIFKNKKLFVHYHEYLSQAGYSESKLLNWVHRQEKKIYRNATWISHTNEMRMELFERDIQINLNNKFILPNYPLQQWKTTCQTKLNSPLRIVYIGALNVKTIFSKEFAQWVEAQNGNVVWDVYSQQDPSAFLKYLESINSKHSKFRGFVDYNELPSILKNYHVGIVLYKGHTENYIHNAPNKLFEYLAAGLDVWFSESMEGCLSYVTKDTFPKVVAVDFENLHSFELNKVLDRSGMTYKASAFYCEDVLPSFLSMLKSDEKIIASGSITKKYPRGIFVQSKI